MTTTELVDWLVLWHRRSDQLFGTAYFPRPDEWPKVGVAGLNQPRNLKEFLALPFKGA